MITQDNLKQTPLKEAHLKLKAKMVPFGGWELPVQYGGILAEYKHTREQASIFDISHMGEFIVEGNCETNGLDKILTCSIKDVPDKSCRYGAILNENGGIIDDMIAFRIEREMWMIVVNGATTDKDAEHIKKNLTKEGRFTDISSEIGKLDIQGPESREVLKPLVKNIEKLDYYTFDTFNVLGEDVVVSRTGYTGELGYEIYYPWAKTEKLWNEILKNDKVKPAGLGARDLLRIEMAYSLYGHELNEDFSPLEAGLERFIDFGKNFIGKGPLVKEKEAGQKRKIVCFVSGTRRSPRHGQKIYDKDSSEIGIVTSGTFSPAIGCGAGIGFVNVDFAKKDNTIYFGDEKSKHNATITTRPFYKNGSLKN